MSRCVLHVNLRNDKKIGQEHVSDIRNLHTIYNRASMLHVTLCDT